MQKVLIIIYYWPPSGGAGVQRWVKLTKYLSRFGIKPYVLTVDEKVASYMDRDETLNKDVAPEVTVIKTQSFEPINMYAKMVGKEKVPTAGFTNVDSTKFRQKIINAIRSNLFIPDPRVGWNSYAYKEAVKIIQQENIDTVITSTPPHSSQLIGLKLKKKLGIKWIVDMRDPWTDIYYYHILGHSFLSHARNKSLEKQVFVHADRITTVSSDLKRLFCEKDRRVAPRKIHLIPNGYDTDDFKGLEATPNEHFTITYTGTIADTYRPSVFFRGVKQMQDANPEAVVKLNLVGRFSDAVRQEVGELGLDATFVPPVPHREANIYQVNANLLLLIIPDIVNIKGHLSGKIFEYLATGNRIISIGPADGDAAAILEECNIGKTFERNQQDEVAAYIQMAYEEFQAGTKVAVDPEEVQRYSREKQAEKVSEIIKGLNEEETHL
ncbi:MAG: glycosyltransferase [Bacteroidota bacterium]